MEFCDSVRKRNVDAVNQTGFNSIRRNLHLKDLETAWHPHQLEYHISRRNLSRWNITVLMLWINMTDSLGLGTDEMRIC